jgi:hypothetical protein
VAAGQLNVDDGEHAEPAVFRALLRARMSFRAVPRARLRTSHGSMMRVVRVALVGSRYSVVGIRELLFANLEWTLVPAGQPHLARPQAAAYALFVRSAQVDMATLRTIWSEARKISRLLDQVNVLRMLMTGYREAVSKSISSLELLDNRLPHRAPAREVSSVSEDVQSLLCTR